MRALVLDRPGTPDSLHLADLPDPEPGPGEVRLRVEACGLNPVDYQVAAGGVPDWTWPHVLGLDVAGVVDAVGAGVTAVQVGDRVVHHGDLRRPGGLAALAVADASAVAVVPAGVEPTVAAALPCAGLTAFQAVRRRLRLAPGATLLVQGGAGGVGGFAVQLGTLDGLRVLATASAGNVAHVRALGAEQVIDYHTEDVAARVRALTDGRGVDGVVDTVGPESATAGLSLLRHTGGIAAVAGRPDLEALAGFGISPSVHEISLGAAYSVGDAAHRADLAVMLAELLDLVAAGRLDPMLNRTVPLTGAPAALAELAGRHVRGKLVVDLRA